MSQRVPQRKQQIKLLKNKLQRHKKFKLQNYQRNLPQLEQQESPQKLKQRGH